MVKEYKLFAIFRDNDITYDPWYGGMAVYKTKEQAEEHLEGIYKLHKTKYSDKYAIKKSELSIREYICKEDVNDLLCD